jgi:virginiamycin B lyase
MKQGIAFVSVMAVAAALVGAQPAGAEPRLAGTFDLSGPPGQITRGSDGNMWVTISGGGNSLAKIEPNGDVTEYDPVAVGNPEGIVSGRDGNIWLTQANEVVKVPTADPASADDFSIPSITDPRGIAKGPDDKLWTASGDQLVSFDEADPEGTDVATTIDGMGARGITSSGGRVWIADFAGQRIVKAAAGGGVKEYDVGGGPQEVAKGPDGSIAYANPGSNPQTVGRIESNGERRKSKVPNSDPFGMVFAPDRRFWFAEFARHKLGILSLNGDVKQFRLPDNSGPRYVAAGPKNRLWVSLETSQKIARVKGVTR